MLLPGVYYCLECCHMKVMSTIYHEGSESHACLMQKALIGAYCFTCSIRELIPTFFVFDQIGFYSSSNYMLIVFRKLLLFPNWHNFSVASVLVYKLPTFRDSVTRVLAHKLLGSPSRGILLIILERGHYWYIRVKRTWTKGFWAKGSWAKGRDF